MSRARTQVKGKNPSLISAGFVSAKPDEDSALHVLRWEFLQTVARIAPEVLRSLHNDLLPIYRKTFGLEVGSPRPTAGTVPPVSPRAKDLVDAMRSDQFTDWYRAAVESGDSLAAPLATALHGWAKHFDLTADWIEDTALRTLRAWETEPDLTGDLRWFMKTAPHGTVLDVELSRFTFHYHWPWEPTIDRRDVARQRILEQFEKELGAHLDRIEQRAIELGYKPAPRKRERAHFDWLVRFQVKGDEQAKIAREHQTKAEGVRMAITRTAQQIGLRLREPPKGRPVRAKP